MFEEFFLLLFVGFLSAFINSVAGGGGLLTYAVLSGLGTVPLQANMITAVGLWPGALTGTAAFASNWKQIVQKEFFILLLMVIGGLLGAVILLNTEEKHFVIIIPYLLLFVFLLFLLKQQLLARIIRNNISSSPTNRHRKIVLAVYLLVALYGSFFGAGMGLLLLATLMIERPGELKELNKIKQLFVLLNSTTAVLLFLSISILPLAKLSCLALSSAVGGWLGTNWSEKLSRKWFDRINLCVSGILCLYYFYKNYAYD